MFLESPSIIGLNDEIILLRCDELYLVAQDGWQDSVGLLAELKIAQKNDIPYRFILLDEDDNIDTILNYEESVCFLNYNLKEA